MAVSDSHRLESGVFRHKTESQIIRGRVSGQDGEARIMPFRPTRTQRHNRSSLRDIRSILTSKYAPSQWLGEKSTAHEVGCCGFFRLRTERTGDGSRSDAYSQHRRFPPGNSTKTPTGPFLSTRPFLVHLCSGRADHCRGMGSGSASVVRFNGSRLRRLGRSAGSSLERGRVRDRGTTTQSS